MPRSFALAPAPLACCLAIGLAACQPSTPTTADVGQPAVEQPAASPASQDAEDRASGFRAVGNEPGWIVEVGTGEAPAMRATLDYGERILEVEHAQRAGDSYTGTTADGTDLKLDINRTSCQDDMSGETFEAGAVLTAGEQSYRGCGAFLSE
jgi:uncharacterized membrane protein